jgi:cyclic beta-1,2-glucan synthetase
MAPSAPNRSDFLRLLIRRTRRDLNQAYQWAARLENPAVSVAASWLLGNRSCLQSQLRECSEALSRATCRRLIRTEGPSESGAPRVHRILEQALTRSGGKFSAAELSRALAPEQTQTSLTLAELWAIPVVAKLVVLERIGRIVANDELDSPGSESRLRASIGCLRSLERVKWRDIIESISLVERQLRQDPSGIYPRMTFESRDLYRKSVERIARANRMTEDKVAEMAVARACESGQRDADPRKMHVGYYLVASGVRLLKQSKAPLALLRSAMEGIPGIPDLGYLAAIAACATLLTLTISRTLGPFPRWWIALLSIAVIQTAIALVNLAVSLFVRPQPLPRLDFSKGIPEDCRTVIAIPTLLLSRDGVAKLIKQLEIHFLANRDPALRFALLTDFADSKVANSPDGDLLNLCSAGIHKLNAQYALPGHGVFYLFHRCCRWNESEQAWMGRERKRGKLEDFNRFLLGKDDAFETKTGDLDALAPVRYVITLDTDTQLPGDTAWKLVGTMAHPLNRAVVDPETKIVREGYAILQPRVSISMDSAGASRLAAIYCGDTGLDPYVTAISDVYQDLCGRATYVGKGIYDLRAFHESLHGRFPANLLLSHDLIEGEHARVGLVTDVDVIEDYPRTYESHAKRKHRWVRGDWQIFEWFLPRVPSAAGPRAPNPLPLISRWKILDNLRRSVFELSLLLALIAGAGFVPARAHWMFAAVLITMVLPAYTEFAAGLLTTARQRFWRSHLIEHASQFWRAHVEAFLSVSFLLHQSLLSADAIVRTLVRRFVTKKRLLEWESMAHSEAGQSEAGKTSLGLVSIYLLACPALGVLVALSWQGRVADLLYIVVGLWIVSPLIARFISARPSSGNPEQPNEIEFLREIALSTWRYFADLSRPAEHWLVPDNIQQAPENVAHQSSPTNIGLQLTAAVAAFDFGYLNHQELAERLEKVTATLGRMERYKGHFYNWYNTRTLEILSPRYISTVDSGNLAAALLTLKQACLQVPNQPIIDVKLIAGLRDCCLRLRNMLPSSIRGTAIMRPIAGLLRLLECRPTNLLFWKGMLTDVASTVAELKPHMEWACDYLEARDSDSAAELRYWNRVLNERIQAAVEGLSSLAPWVARPCEAELRVRAANPRFQDLITAASSIPVLTEMPAAYDAVAKAAGQLLAEPETVNGTFRDCLAQLLSEIEAARARCVDLLDQFKAQSHAASRWAIDMNFAFLLDRDCDLLRIGYNAETGRFDDSYYDLLASEARTAVFFAVAKGDIGRDAWFALGRMITSFRGWRSLISWSGTMFEYLMPALFMKSFVSTLLYQTMGGVVRIQQAFARDYGIPWGISESACSSRDDGLRYVYRAFGVPAVSLSSSTETRAATKAPLVVAPYASVLALLVDRRTAIANLRDMASRGWTGRYGFFESIDFGTGRATGVYQPTIVRSFMAHHQGMTLLALCNTICENIMQKRFHSDPLVASAQRLLQERIPAALGPPEEESTALKEIDFSVSAASADASVS